MKIFLDANVLLAVVNKEYPLYSHAARIVSLAGQKGYTMYTSPVCLAIAFYFAEKKSKTLAKKKLSILASHLKIAPILASGVQSTLNNSKINDFEDGLEYYAAIDAGCTLIITEDTEDFRFSDIEVVNCEGFIDRRLKIKD